MPRYSGVVSFIDEADGFAEISMEGHAPVVCNLAELRAIGGDAIGCRIDFEHGSVRLRHAVGPAGPSGAVRLSKPRPVP